MRALRTLLAAAGVAASLAIVFAALFFGAPGEAQEDEQSTLGNLLSRVLSTPAQQVKIGSIDGALSSNATIHNVSIADHDGVWLEVKEAKIVWSRLALFSGRLQVDDLEISGLDLKRKPLPSENPPDSDQPILPQLPVKVVVDKFALNDFTLGEPVLGVAAKLAADGHASLGDPKEGLDFGLNARRLDAPGTFVVKLAYKPESQDLNLALDFNEPEGGLAARLMDIPGLPPVVLKVQGEGPLDSWKAGLDFNAGPTIGARGQAVLARTGGIRRLNLDLDSRIAGLVPAVVAPVVAGNTQLNGSVVFGDDGGYAIEKMVLASNVAELGISGYITANRQLDLKLAGRAKPTESGGATVAGRARIDKLALDARLTGPLSAPQLNGTLDAAGLSLPEASLDSLAARIAMTPVEGTKTFNLGAEVKARGFHPRDEALARAVGDHLDLEARGVLGADRVVDVELARIAIPTASIGYKGRFGAKIVQGDVTAAVPDLSAFSGLVDRPLAGAANLMAHLDGNPRKVVKAALDAKISGLSTGVERVDRVLGTEVTAKGGISRVPGGFSTDGLKVEGRNASLEFNGIATQQTADLRVQGELTDLRSVDERLGGRAGLHARLWGSLRKPNIAGKLSVPQGTALGRPVKDFDIGVDARDLKGALVASAAMDGYISDKAAQLRMHVARQQPAGWNLDQLELNVGSVMASGKLTLDAQNLAAGKLNIWAQNLDDLSPLLLTKLAGKLNLEVALDAPEGRQNAQIKGDGQSLAFGANSVRDFHADARVTDLWNRPVADGIISASAITAAGQSFQSVRLTAQGSPQGSVLDVSAKASGFDLAGHGTLVPAQPTRLDLDSFSARRGGRQVKLAGPGSITFEKGGVTLRDIVVAVEKGRIAISGSAGQQLSLDIDAKNVPLSAAEIAKPGIGLAGTLNASAHVTGTSSAPGGDYKLAISGLSVPATRNAGIPSIAIDAKGTLKDGKAGVDAKVNAGRAGALTVQGSVPVSGSGLDLRARGTIDAAIANATLGARGQRVTGKLAVDLTAKGSFANPLLGGTVGLSGGSFTDELHGVALKAITARLVARGNAITVERFSAQTKRNGTLSASGKVTVNPAAGFPADLTIKGNRATLVDSDIVTTVADLDLRVTGPVARSPTISGRVDIISMDVSIPDHLPATLAPLPETKHVGAPPVARERLAIIARENTSSGPPFKATLDLAIRARNRIFVRGRGLNAELGGRLQLTGTTAAPNAVGAFDLRDGRFDILGHRFDLTRGHLGFAGDLVPDLDFLAETTAGDVTAQIGITGNARQPEFSFTSTPALPQDEVISRILFNKDTGSLSAGQALQLAQAVAQFSGGGPGVFENLRKSLGVDSLDISTSASGGVTVGVSRYISDRVSVGVKGGAKPEDNGVVVNMDITRHIKAQAEADSNGAAKAGAAMEWEY